MTTLEVPLKMNGSEHRTNDISIVVENASDDDMITQEDDMNEVVGNHNETSIDTLTKEDLGLNVDESDDVYDGLIRDFRKKMDSLSFKRLSENEIKNQAANFLAQREQGNSMIFLEQLGVRNRL